MAYANTIAQAITEVEQELQALVQASYPTAAAIIFEWEYADASDPGDLYYCPSLAAITDAEGVVLLGTADNPGSLPDHLKAIAVLGEDGESMSDDELTDLCNTLWGVHTHLEASDSSRPSDRLDFT